MSFYINFIHCYMLTYGETADYLMEVNEYILEISGITKEHEPKNESKNAKAANTRSDDLENLGTEIETVSSFV